jgi:hypothetical protein
VNPDHGSGGKSFRNKAGGSERATQGQEHEHEEEDAPRAPIVFIVWLPGAAAVHVPSMAHEATPEREDKGCAAKPGGEKEQLSKLGEMSGCGKATYQFPTCPKHLECDKAFEPLQCT